MRTQLLKVPPAAPPPPPSTSVQSVPLLVSAQSFSTAHMLPPPTSAAELDVIVQWLSVPPNAPPPRDEAELPAMMQLDTVALNDSHHTPPPVPCRSSG